MKLYRCNDALFEPGQEHPLGHFGEMMRDLGGLAWEFESLMEERRLVLAPKAPSRLTGLFAFDNKVIEGYQGTQQYLYELDATGHSPSVHNYKIGTYFSQLVSSNNRAQLLLEDALVDAYWSRPARYFDSAGRELPMVEEYLFSTPPRILRRLPWEPLKLPS